MVDEVLTEPVAAGRGGRRRALGVTTIAMVVVAATGGGAAVFAQDSRAMVVAPADGGAPADTRLVGLGRAAIAVPGGWGTNKARCGTPQEDTIVIDVWVVANCLVGRPAGVESVELRPGTPRFAHDASALEIDGVAAERQATTCKAAYEDTTVCSGAVRIPSEGVTFLAESSTGLADVDRILGWIRIVPGRVAVPGYQRISMEEQSGAGAAYVRALKKAGLTARIRTEKRAAVDPGFLLGVSPAPGTMMRPGDVVTVTVVAEPEGPADEVRVELNTNHTYGRNRGLEDEEIRAGGTIDLAVGDRIWAHASGKRKKTFAGEIDGGSLKLVPWKDGPTYGRSWKAIKPGITKITLTIKADGERVVLGVVTVRVG